MVLVESLMIYKIWIIVLITRVSRIDSQLIFMKIIITIIVEEEPYSMKVSTSNSWSNNKLINQLKMKQLSNFNSNLIKKFRQIRI